MIADLKSSIFCQIWLAQTKKKDSLLKFLPNLLLIVGEHFFHTITLLFTVRLAKFCNIGGALRVAPVCSTPNTVYFQTWPCTMLSAHSWPGQWLNAERWPRSSLGNTGGAAGARTRDWSWSEPEPLASIRARPLPRAPSDHTALLLLRLSDQDQV